MATPIRLDKKSNLGSNAVPSDDVSAIGGAINTGSNINENTVDNLFGDLRINNSDIYYYSIVYERFINTSSGSMQNARVGNRAGAKLNTSPGTVTLVSTNIADTGSYRVTGKVSGVWTTEDIVATGTTPATGVHTFDVSTVVRYESLAGTPLGAVTFSVASDVCGVIWGTDNDPLDGAPSIATYMATAEIDLAVATAINTTLSSANRLTAPTGIGSFSKATLWTGADATIAVPGGVLAVGDKIAVCVRFKAFNGIPATASGKIQFKHGIVGDATP